MNEGIRILDHKEAYVNDVFLSLMMVYGQRTLLPEIMDVFGKEATRKFLDVFAGLEVKVPPRSDVEMAARNAHIFGALAKKLETADSLAVQYGLKKEQVAEIFRRTKAILVRHGYVEDTEPATGDSDG